MNNNEKIKASLLFASYFETLGFKNKEWEFNYNTRCKTLESYINISNKMLNYFIILGGANYINLDGWNSSDDTILILATYRACINGGGYENYRKEYIKVLDILKDGKRSPGITTLESIRSLMFNQNLKISKSMGGNGAAMRTGPIGLLFYDNIEKVINESIIASKLTHNYYIGYMGGLVTALFTAFAMNNICKFEWVNKLLELYESKNYLFNFGKKKDLDTYISYWKKYKEIRMDHFNLLDNNIINFNERINFLSEFFPNNDLNKYENMTKSGLDCCIYAYDCLLITNNLYSFMTLVCIHPGDNDTTGAIGGTWYGAMNGFNNFNLDRFKELEFYHIINKI